MKQNKVLLSLLTAGLLFSFPLYGEDPEEKGKKNLPGKTKKESGIVERKISDQEEDQEAKPEKKQKWGLVPFVLPFYSPDTSGALAFAFVFYYNPDPADPGRKPDEVTVGGTATLKKQSALKLDTVFYFNQDSYKLNTSIAVANYPQYFWGVGPRSKDWMKERYTPVSLTVETSFLFKLVNHLYLGPAYHFAYLETWDRETGRQLSLRLVPGADGATISGFGANLTWDSRDSVFYPRRGVFADVRALGYRRELGSKYNYSRLEADLRAFFRVFGQHIVAVQFLARMNFGTMPFSFMPQLGGMEKMRGYLDGRYMDNNALILQMEYRFPLVWRFSGVLFGSIGSVAPGLDRVNPKYFRYAWGPGLRFAVDRDEMINLRLDCGFDERLNPGFYFFIKEAF